MRPFFARPFARLAFTALLAATTATGCANRGMVAPNEQTGTGGGLTGTGGKGGSGGTAGKGGGSGGTNVDASCSLVTDALFDHSLTTCGATFNFEGSDNLERATLVAGSAFTAVAQATTPHTYCGTGALAITAAFSGTSGAMEKGEVDIPLGVDGGSADLSGKTLTIHVAASPAACGEDLRFTVVLKTATGSPAAINVNALTSNFLTASKSLASVSGAAAANALAIEAFSTTNYTGTIYVDEIDLQ